MAGGGTIVILMGVAALPLIAAKLLEAGMERGMPVVVLENGCTPAQRVVRGSISDITQFAARDDVRSPAVIVIGQVAKLAG